MTYLDDPRWQSALETRISRALDVLVPPVLRPLPDDIPGEVVPQPTWSPEKITTFEGRAGRLLVVKLPARRVDVDPFPPGFADDFAVAFRTRNGLLVWDLLQRTGVA